MLFANDAGIANNTQQELQSLMDCFCQSCKDFGLTTTLKKTNVLAQHKQSALWQKSTGRPRMRYKDVCMRDMKALDIMRSIVGGPCSWPHEVKYPEPTHHHHHHWFIVQPQRPMVERRPPHAASTSSYLALSSARWYPSSSRLVRLSNVSPVFL